MRSIPNFFSSSVISHCFESLIDASKEVGPEVNTEKTKYMLLSCHQNAGQNHDVKRANRRFENVAGSDIWERL
jgi:hypothetical protein